ncbi:M81 family metallopeptidase [Sphaerochaeta sp. PS]|uniref:M81 family metallopeptidase n=1 Tax=Sphaerochaeta sp. PS TaxID=3076336 RepID=UPI0028A5789F|nr:M81 family metallopeptidase [Sphaerochaeta sp. PS]MDT4761568.1 M81 family metallopeptidase [Sphaerochaeta sp. PS]
MKKRVFVGGLHHESDTFNPIITGRDDIWVTRGEDLLANKGRSSVNGIIATLTCAGYEVIPSLIARAVPNGVWDREYYLELKEELLTALKKAGKIDGISLSLHGSMRVDGIGEAEQDLLASIRLVHPKLPIITSLDMHATLTRRMFSSLDGMVGYKCAPHTDTYETGIHSALMMIRALEEGFLPTSAACRIPMLIAGEQSETSVEPMRSLIEECRRIERTEHVLSCSYLLGFPWADGEENGVHAVVTTDGDQGLADRLAREMGELFWGRRREFGFYNETRMPSDALEATRKSLEDGVFPVVISDSGDNPTAGSSQDVTTFLSLILEDKTLSSLTPPLVYQGFYDPEVVMLAKEAGVGKTIGTTLGAKFDTLKSKGIAIRAEVKAIVEKWEGAYNSDLVLLDVQGIDVVVTGKHVGCYDPEMMRILGVVPEERKVIVVKLGYLEPEIRSIARRSMMALTTGSTDELFERLPYRKLKRPIYPLDGEFEAELVLL